MNENTFNVDNFGVNDGVLKMYFKDGDIQLIIGRNIYLLESNVNSFIEYDLATHQVLNKTANFVFVTKEGLKGQYMLSQLTNFKGISDAINEFVSSSLDENNIRLDKSTHELVEQIMDFHKDNLVNVHLDNYNEEELQKISLIL